MEQTVRNILMGKLAHMKRASNLTLMGKVESGKEP